MKELFLTLLIGVVAEVIDVLPMIKMKLDNYSKASAFVHYLIAPFIIFNTVLFDMAWWLKGGVLNLLLAVPVIILGAKDEKNRRCQWRLLPLFWARRSVLPATLYCRRLIT